MSYPGKTPRNGLFSRYTGAATSQSYATPGKRTLTQGISRHGAPAIAEPTQDAIAEVMATLASDPCSDPQPGDDCTTLTEGDRQIVLVMTADRATTAVQRWMSSLLTGYTDAIAAHQASVSLALEILSSGAMVGIPFAVAKGAALVHRMRALNQAYRTLNILDKVAEGKDKLASVMHSTIGPVRARALRLASKKTDNPRADLQLALRDIPGIWKAEILKQAIALDDGGRIALCAALDEDSLPIEMWDAAVATAVQRFEQQVMVIGAAPSGGTHAAYLMNAHGTMRLAVVSFSKLQQDFAPDDLPRHRMEGTDRYTFVRFIDDEMAPAALTSQIRNTFPPVIRIDDGAALENPDAPELQQWRQESTPQFQPQVAP